MTHQAWTPLRLAGWVQEKFGGHAASVQEIWCDDLRRAGFTIAAYERADGTVLLVPFDRCTPPDALPCADALSADPVRLAGVCYPPDMANVIPLPLAAEG